MCVAFWTLALMTCVLASAQAAAPTFDLRGNLKLVDLPPAATPVEAMLVSLRPLNGGVSVQAWPDHNGDFVLKNLRPGSYALILPTPGRIVTFARGGQNLSPGKFQLATGGAPLHIVLSLKTSSLLVEARGLPVNISHLVVLLAPADPYLALRTSCFQRPLNGPETEFRYIPPGRYRVFIVDSQFLNQAAVYAPRYPDFLKNRATPVEVLNEGEAKATATYVDGNTIQQAVLRSGSRPSR